MSSTLNKMPPPPRPTPTPANTSEAPEVKSRPAATTRKAPPPKFDQVKEDERVQFNKRVTRRVADGFEMLAIRTRHKVPELLAEALDLLEERYGKV
jgi:hypothetical protein